MRTSFFPRTGSLRVWPSRSGCMPESRIAQAGPILVAVQLTGLRKSLRVAMALDTDATLTVISMGTARSIGYDPSKSRDRVELMTAGGIVHAPKLKLRGAGVDRVLDRAGRVGDVDRARAGGVSLPRGQGQEPRRQARPQPAPSRVLSIRRSIPCLAMRPRVCYSPKEVLA